MNEVSTLPLMSSVIEDLYIPKRKIRIPKAILTSRPW